MMVDVLLQFLADTIDRRPVVKVRECWLWRLLPRPWQNANITLGWTLYAKPGMFDLGADQAVMLIAHEGAHWIQRHRWGRLGFLLRYLTRKGRAAIEAEAYAIEAHAYDAFRAGDTREFVENAATAMESKVYMLGPGGYEDMIDGYFACPNLDTKPWISKVEASAKHVVLQDV